MNNERKVVLIVDDEPDVVFMLESRLKSWGYSAVSVSDGREAIAAAGRTPRPDLVIMDLQMPIMDGRQACRHFKSDPDLRNIPIILVTANAEVIQKDQLEQGLADAYVIKPFDAADLRRKVKALIGLSGPVTGAERGAA
ncbi:MAG: Alkaline phosphatase synthesis transcriptional regulatory protein PhoP [Candidatus Omnitrophica bacterium]|nr:Alkaline phosphatase synthesis transcriptional regulatory protein PhoP [Candidatus Omnitrophota bacterium]